MRLLDTHKLEIVSVPDNDIPPYAILSHTWTADEVSLKDMQGFSGKLLSAATSVKLVKAKNGLKKVTEAAKLAASQNYGWIWIDTCCIDKTSSAELSELINSMYRWYRKSEVCYVYLEDVPKIHEWDAHHALGGCRWTTRGWTLQELISPRKVKFYSNRWEFLGEKTDTLLLHALAAETGVEVGVLSGQVLTAEVSVANRMKWASKRKTTRPEDIAYCLMGIFGVHMPLLYGEGGERAFIRLQEEILKATDDLFA